MKTLKWFKIAMIISYLVLILSIVYNNVFLICTFLIITAILTAIFLAGRNIVNGTIQTYKHELTTNNKLDNKINFNSDDLTFIKIEKNIKEIKRM